MSSDTDATPCIEDDDTLAMAKSADDYFQNSLKHMHLLRSFDDDMQRSLSICMPRRISNKLHPQTSWLRIQRI